MFVRSNVPYKYNKPLQNVYGFPKQALISHTYFHEFMQEIDIEHSITIKFLAIQSIYFHRESHALN